MDNLLNTIHHGDCIAGIDNLPEGSVNLAFADPPFNIGYDYDVYDDKREHQDYISWSADWMRAVHRVLADDGTFWLAIGDEYAAELKIEATKLGFHCRSWVIWYYTFGVNCSRKFSRSHAHLFHFVKDPDNYTFRHEDKANRIPSARQLVYNDKRANPKGRLADDTWIIRPADVVGDLMDSSGDLAFDKVPPPADTDHTFTLRPQDIEQRFSKGEDTWYFPRVAGTFKERAGFHGCQMPEQLLGRIIRFCSHENEVVLDPFSGSATTLAVAKKLGRRFVGFELSPEYVAHGLKRLESARVGDLLDGAPEPTVSAPSTSNGRKKKQKSLFNPLSGGDNGKNQLGMTIGTIVKAFAETNEGYSVDRVVADPKLNRAFTRICLESNIAGDPRSWNSLLFRLRKAGKLKSIATSRRTKLSWTDCEPFFFASEMAWKIVAEEYGGESLDEILCDPYLSDMFNTHAMLLAPGYSAFEFRWAALKLRKEASNVRHRSASLVPPNRLGRRFDAFDIDLNKVPKRAGAYFLKTAAGKPIYIGETSNLQTQLAQQFPVSQQHIWRVFSDELIVQVFPADVTQAGTLAWQSCLVRKFKPWLNIDSLITI